MHVCTYLQLRFIFFFRKYVLSCLYCLNFYLEYLINLVKKISIHSVFTRSFVISPGLDYMHPYMYDSPLAVFVCYFFDSKDKLVK